jgi:Cu/Ag efflux protein CusF
MARCLPALRPLPFLLAGALLLGAGCGAEQDAGERIERTTYTDVRARFLGTASEGRDIVVHHEPIPDLMGAMVMTLPVADARDLDPIDKNAPIAFDLVIEGASLRAENIEALPDTVTLNLSADP